jgi:hypothetical protein
MHCANLALPALASTTIDVWTAALHAPPMRYCLTGYADASTVAWASTPQPAGDCVDVYRDAVSPHDVVVEGPIALATSAGEAGRYEWIGGNYSDNDLTNVAVTIAAPSGNAISAFSSRSWACSEDVSAATWTCSTPFLAAGASFAIEASN